MPAELSHSVCRVADKESLLSTGLTFNWQFWVGFHYNFVWSKQMNSCTWSEPFVYVMTPMVSQYNSHIITYI